MSKLATIKVPSHLARGGAHDVSSGVVDTELISTDLVNGTLRGEEVIMMHEVGGLEKVLIENTTTYYNKKNYFIKPSTPSRFLRYWITV